MHSAQLNLVQLLSKTAEPLRKPQHHFEADYSPQSTAIVISYYIAALVVAIICVRLLSKNIYMTVITFLVSAGHILTHVLIEGMDVTTALYVTVQISTTIGYGDITPATTSGRVATAMLVLWILVALAFVMGKLVSAVTDPDAAGSAWSNWAKASGYFVGAILMGTVFFATYEDCSCSYGITAQAGCTDGTYAECVASSGYVKTWLEACYFSIITLTTVGFGDFTPVTPLGRMLGICWMLLGVALAANWLAATTALMFESEAAPDIDTQATFKNLDTNGDGALGELEYCMYELMKQGVVSSDKLTEIRKQFGDLQKKNKEVATYDEVEQSDKKD